MHITKQACKKALAFMTIERETSRKQGPFLSFTRIRKCENTGKLQYFSDSTHSLTQLVFGFEQAESYVILAYFAKTRARQRGDGRTFQQRVGKLFTCLIFRSMYPSVDATV